MSGTAQGFRVEKDTMGEVRVPADAYFGAQTQRAIDNFPISGLRFPREFIRALGIIKLAAAKANMQLGLLDTKKGDAIIKAAQEVMDGKLDGQFAVDIFQTGSGTSTNMNANEVIANRGIELLGGKRGDKGILHPNDHVNIGQSTNDVFPTAIHVSALEAIEKKLLPSLKILRDTLKAKAEEFKDVVKAGRTHLQDAVPVTLGQEFGAYASMIDHGIRRIEAARGHLSELPLGGTATGTGLNADPKFAETAIAEISRTTGVKFRKCENMFEGMQGKDAAVEASGAVRTVAVSLNKIANDIRLLNAGPRTGFGEIELPPTQPGSSIMPAKVNPVIPEAVVMVVAKILGNDVTVTFSGAAGQLELNIMMPVIAYSLLESINLEANASKVLAEKCIKGITANKELCLKYAESSLALITAISPVIGYDNSAKVAKKALSGGKTVREIVLEEGIMTKEQMDKVFNLKKMTEGGIM